MISSESVEGQTLYWLTCDNCGDFTVQYDSKGEMLEETMGDGWRKNPTLGKHFCGLPCELYYLAKLAAKEGGEA